MQAPATVKLVGSDQASPLFVLGEYMRPQNSPLHAACTTVQTGVTCRVLCGGRNARPSSDSIDAVGTGNDQDEYGFERGSRKSYELDTGQELGVLRQVQVQQVSGRVATCLSAADGATQRLVLKKSRRMILDVGTAPTQVHASVAEVGNDWYLDRIEVTGPGGVRWQFPCDAWLGRQEGDDYEGAQESGPDPPLVGMMAVLYGKCAVHARRRRLKQPLAVLRRPLKERLPLFTNVSKLLCALPVRAK